MKISAFAIVDKTHPHIDTKEIYSASEIKDVVVEKDEVVIKIIISQVI